jgi:hypothetical protein
VLALEVPEDPRLDAIPSFFPLTVLVLLAEMPWLDGTDKGITNFVVLLIVPLRIDVEPDE